MLEIFFLDPTRFEPNATVTIDLFILPSRRSYYDNGDCVVDLCCPCGDDAGAVGVCNGTELCGGVGDGYNRFMRFLWYDGTVTTDVLYMTMMVHVRWAHTHQHPDHDSTYGPHVVCHPYAIHASATSQRTCV